MYFGTNIYHSLESLENNYKSEPDDYSQKSLKLYNGILTTIMILAYTGISGMYFVTNIYHMLESLENNYKSEPDDDSKHKFQIFHQDYWR